MTLGLRGLFCGNRNWGLSVSLRGQRLKVLVVYCDDRLGVHLAGCKRQVVDLVVDCMIKELWARFGVTGTSDPVVHYRVTDPGSDYTSFWVSD